MTPSNISRCNILIVTITIRWLASNYGIRKSGSEKILMKKPGSNMSSKKNNADPWSNEKDDPWKSMPHDINKNKLHSSVKNIKQPNKHLNSIATSCPNCGNTVTLHYKWSNKLIPLVIAAAFGVLGVSIITGQVKGDAGGGMIFILLGTAVLLINFIPWHPRETINENCAKCGVQIKAEYKKEDNHKKYWATSVVKAIEQNQSSQLVRGFQADENSSGSLENKKESLTVAEITMLISALLLVLSLIWYFGINLIIKGIAGLLLIAFIATGIGAIIVGLILIILGKPVVSILPLVLLGLKTLGIVVGLSLLLILMFSVIGSSDQDNKSGNAD